MKKTIIMIHGFRGTHHGLAKISEQLDSMYDLITPDLPGFGDGDRLDHYTMADYVAWLLDFIVTQHLSEPPILLGHSFGSSIASAYAAAHPETIDRLVLVNPIGAPALDSPRYILTKLTVAYYWLGRVLPEPIAAKWLTSRLLVLLMSRAMTKTKDAALRAWIHQEHLRYFSLFHSPRVLSEAFSTSATTSVRDTASAIVTPTLLIVGDQDDITPLECQYELDQQIADSSLRVIEGVGHLTHYETPDVVARYVHEFMTSE